MGVVPIKYDLLQEVINLKQTNRNCKNAFKKIVHGLYRHHNGHRIPDGYEVTKYYCDRKIPEEQRNVICYLPLLSVGHTKVFEYSYGEIDNDKNKVYIAMMFFESRLIEITMKK